MRQEELHQCSEIPTPAHNLPILGQTEIDAIKNDEYKHYAVRSASIIELLADFEREVPKDKNFVFLGDSYFGGFNEVRSLAQKKRLALFTCNANRTSVIFSQARQGIDTVT